MVHPTAVVHPDARLGANVRVGPYVVIEGPAEVGDGCVLEAHASLVGRVRLGKNNRVGHGAVLGGWPQDLAFDPAVTTDSGVEVGDGNTFREHVTVHRGSAPGSVTRVGDGCFLMASAHVGHNARVGDGAILANGVLLGGHVEVGPRAFLGGGSVFHQFVRVGRGVIVQGLSAFSKDVPPWTLAAERNTVAGLNVVGLRRAAVAPAARAELRRAFALLYAGGLNVSQALARAGEQTWAGAPAREFWEFVASARRRGLCAALRRRSASSSSGEDEAGKGED